MAICQNCGKSVLGILLDGAKLCPECRKTAKPATQMNTAYAPKVPANMSSKPSTRSDLTEGGLPYNKAQAQEMGQLWIKKLNAASKKANTTVKPKDFFDQYNHALDMAERLAYIKRWVRFEGEAPDVCFRRMYYDYPAETNKMIDRYAQDIRLKLYKLTTQKSKENKPTEFRNTLLEFRELMQDASIAHMEQVYTDLKKLVGQDT